MTYKKFDAKTRAKFQRRLRELYDAHSSAEIVKIMTDEGFTDPAGKALTQRQILNQATHLGLKKAKCHRAVLPPKLREQESKDAEALVSLIMASGIPKRKKLKALAALL